MTSLVSNSNLWEILGWTMLHFLWTGCVAFAVSAGVRWSVRRHSPELRYLVALLCLLSVTGAAGAALIVSVQHVNSGVVASRSAALPREFTSAEAPPLPMDLIGRSSLLPPHAAPSQPAVRDLTPAEALREEVLHGTLSAIAPLLPWLWVCGTPLVVLALITGIIGTTRLRRRATAVSESELLRQLQRLRVAVGVSRRVGLAVCEQVSSPLVIGILRPLIVLPPAMISGLAPAQLEMILLHELAHVRRWDNLVNLAQRTIEALLFYHPVVWWASRWVRLEREHCCDVLVLAHDHTPQSYAETLATLALPELAPPFATAAMANHQLTSRICHILNVEEKTMTVSMRTLFGGMVLLAAGAGGFLLATLRPDRVVADDREQIVADTPEQDGISEADPRQSELTGRLMFGVGVNSDAGVTGHIVTEDEMFSSLLGLVADGDGVIGETLATWGRRGWSANEATGPPDVPEAGDNERAWASLTEDGQVEWLRLAFEKPVRPAAVVVYESFNPGALYKVTTVDREGAVVVVWQGEDPVAIQDGKGVSIIRPQQPQELSEVTLHINSPDVAGWNEIDAVGLIDRDTGEVHWAASAEASSSYADRTTDSHADYYHHYVGELDLERRCGNCHTGVHGSAVAPPGSARQRIEQLRSELQRLEWELLVQELLNSQHSSEMGPDVNRLWKELFREFDESSNLRTPSDELEPSELKAMQDWIDAGREWEPSADAPENPAGEESQLQAELKRLEAELARERAMSAQALAERMLNSSAEQLPADRPAGGGASDETMPPGATDAYREWVLRLLNEPESGAADEAVQFEELKNTLLEQQQAIERLTEILEQLQHRLNTRDEEERTESESGAWTTPAIGPAPLALDFAVPPGEPRNVIDELILERLRSQGLEAARVLDEEFIRRVYLDLLGRVPTAEETRQFLDDESETAREDLIKRLSPPGDGDARSELNRNWSFYLGVQNATDDHSARP